MKIHIKFITLFIVVSIILSAFVGCHSSDVLSKLDELQINDNNISKYKIVYAAPDPDSVKWENYYFGIEYKYDYLTAIELKDRIFNIFDVELDVVSDTDSQISEYEILIGATNRTETESLSLGNLNKNDRLCRVSDNKLIICGGSYLATYHCIDLLIDEFIKQAGNSSRVVMLNSSFLAQKNYDTKNIAVIGDSTFQHSNFAESNKLSVPAVLERILWKDYSVKSYIEGNTTVRADLSNSTQFISTQSYNNLIQDCSNLSAVIINLGTFDEYFCDGDWNKSDDSMFLSCYKNLIDELKSINPNLKFYICTSIANDGNQAIIKSQINVFKTLKDLKYNVEIIDTHNLLGEYITSSSLINEVYPNEYACAIIAKKISDIFSQQTSK